MSDSGDERQEPRIEELEDQDVFSPGPADPSLYSKATLRKPSKGARKRGCLTSFGGLVLIGITVGSAIWRDADGDSAMRSVIVLGLSGWILVMTGGVEVVTGKYWKELSPNKRAGVMALLGVGFIAGLILTGFIWARW